MRTFTDSDELRPLAVRARGRDLGQHGQQTLRKLLDAGLAEFCDKGFSAVRVEDVVLRAKTSHGTFYLYFESKEDLFTTLLRGVLADMRDLSGDFPVVTQNEAGRTALRSWVRRFCAIYAEHASVIRVLSQAEIVSDDIWQAGLDVLCDLARSMALGMTAAQPTAPGSGDNELRLAANAELTAFACVTMLERVNYLLSVGVSISSAQMTDRITDIFLAAFAR